MGILKGSSFRRYLTMILFPLTIILSLMRCSLSKSTSQMLASLNNNTHLLVTAEKKDTNPNTSGKIRNTQFDYNQSDQDEDKYEYDYYEYDQSEECPAPARAKMSSIL